MPVYTPPAEEPDEEYPLYLTTGRVVSQYLSGAQTRRIGPLVDQYPEPRIELHPSLAEKLGIVDGDWATAESRRGSVTLRASVVRTIRPARSSFPTTGPTKQCEPADDLGPGPDFRIPEYRSAPYGLPGGR